MPFQGLRRGDVPAARQLREPLRLGGRVASRPPSPNGPDLPRDAGLLGLLDKEESLEKSRPYFRYSLKTTRITLDLDLASLAVDDAPSSLGKRIRERRNAGARFTEARGGNAISSVAVWTGEGRSPQERKLTLTEAQGAFLYHLPFLGAEPLSVSAIMKKAGVDESRAPEILDMVGRLEALGVAEARPITAAKPARTLE